MKDILNNKSLKTMPYDVPEGYFEGLRQSLSQKRERQQIMWPRYIAAAACLAFLVAAGGWFLSSKSQPDFFYEDYIVFSDEMTNTIMYEEEQWYAEAATEEDMIEYLIYIGAEIDELY